MSFMNFYMDESGERAPQREISTPQTGVPWFSMGGILIKDSDEAEVRERHRVFCQKWNITYPLHSVEIRNKSQNFKWLNALQKDTLNTFYTDLENFILNIPVIGIACIISREGYHKRYIPKYGRNSWHLCKTAFNIAIERSLKYSISKNCRMRVYFERSNKQDDRRIKSYYSDLKISGMPFSSETSSTYAPLKQNDFSNYLYDIKDKAKSSPMIQLADLYLWPISKCTIDQEYLPYLKLIERKRLIESYIPRADWPILGSKYSCYNE